MPNREIHYHTPAQVRGYIDEALTIVAEHELDDELRSIAFAKAIDLLAGKQLILEQTALSTAALAGLRAH